LNVPAEEVPRDFVDAVVAQNLFTPLLVPFAMLLNTSFAFGVSTAGEPSTAQVGREAGADGRLLSGEAVWGLRHARRPSSAATASRSSGGRSPRWLKELG